MSTIQGIIKESYEAGEITYKNYVDLINRFILRKIKIFKELNKEYKLNLEIKKDG